MTNTLAPKTVAYRQQDSQPWIGLPAVKNPGSASTAEMMESAGLIGWDVRLDEISPDLLGLNSGGEPVYEEVDSPSFKVLRTNPVTGLPHRLAIVGNRYKVVQNEELLAMADTITDGDVTLDAAGHYNNGRKVFLTFTLGDNIVLDPNGAHDEIGRYLTITSSHDGSSGIVAVTNNMRIVCQNMLTSNRLSALSTFKMRHTQNVSGRIADAREALGIAFKASEAFEKEMQALVEAEMSKQEFWKVVQKVYPRPEKDVKGSVKKWEDKTDTIMGLWSGPTNEMLPDSAYKGYNALNEHLMWYSSVRAGNVEGALVKASGLDETTNKANLSLYKQVLLSL